jgi:hypothetical protein
MKLPSDFKELLEEFAREGVEHVVIGRYASGGEPASPHSATSGGTPRQSSKRV